MNDRFYAPALLLCAWPMLATADDLERQLEQNLRVYGHAPAAPSGVAPDPPGNQAVMVVYDRGGRPQARQRVSLGTTPPPPSPEEKPMTEYPRHPRPPEPRYEIGYSFTAGYRQDRLNWNIAAPNTGSAYGYNGHPNVLSELKWENINVAQLNAKTEITSPRGWHFQGKVGYGFITGGKNQDSDYDGDNRTLEWSRSNNSADGGYMLDASVGAGYRFAYRDKEGLVRLSATPLAGYAYNQQDLQITKLVQTVSQPSTVYPVAPPPVGYVNYALDSSYNAQWHGPWLGIRGTAVPFEWMEIFGQFEYHWTNYYAKANWNLRTDLAHPVSFKHWADGQGLMANAGIRFKLTPAWALEMDANYTDMSTDAGKDQTYFSDSTIGITRLNRVNWDSFGANAGVRYQF